MSDLVKTIEEKVKAITDTGIFELNGKTVKITPLQFQYQQQFTKIFQPLVEAISMRLASNEQVVDTNAQGQMIYRQKTFYDFTPADYANIASILIGNIDVFYKLIQIICHNGGYLITEEELDQSVLTTDEMQTIILKSLSVGGKLQYKIATTVMGFLEQGDNLLDGLIAEVAGTNQPESNDAAETAASVQKALNDFTHRTFNGQTGTGDSLARQVLEEPAQPVKKKGRPPGKKATVDTQLLDRS